MNTRFINLYMDLAERVAQMSRATRLKVGAVVVKDENIIAYSWNGTPAGWDNTCETKVYLNGDASTWLSPEEIQEQYPYVETDDHGNYLGRYLLKTKPEVMHAERNSLDKLARGPAGGLGATLFVTHSPCLECAKSIYGAGIKEVIYKHDYRSSDGITFLKSCNVTVKKLEN